MVTIRYIYINRGIEWNKTTIPYNIHFVHENKKKVCCIIEKSFTLEISIQIYTTVVKVYKINIFLIVLCVDWIYYKCTRNKQNRTNNVNLLEVRKNNSQMVYRQIPYFRRRS